uniref:(northern house mosquito) hypothetical protein n=1 Tax=Culex pipiens TaxID=7175 RepID=A0A8D8G382_CULPI
MLSISIRSFTRQRYSTCGLLHSPKISSSWLPLKVIRFNWGIFPRKEVITVVPFGVNVTSIIFSRGRFVPTSVSSSPVAMMVRSLMKRCIRLNCAAEACPPS